MDRCGLMTCTSRAITSLLLVGVSRLDSDPPNKRQASKPCAPGSEEGCGFDPEYIWVTPRWIEIALTLSAFPAFILAVSVAHGMARLGNQRTTELYASDASQHFRVVL